MQSYSRTQDISFDRNLGLTGWIRYHQEPVKGIKVIQDAVTQTGLPIDELRLLRALVNVGAWSQIISYLLENPTADMRSVRAIIRGRVLYSPDDEAVAWLPVVVHFAPDYLLDYAKQFLLQSRLVVAAEWAVAATESNPSGAARLLEGQILFYQGYYDEAVTLLTLLSSESPEDADAAYWLGRSLLYSGKLMAAIPELETAARLDTSPDSAWALHDLGNALTKMGHCSDAKDAFREGLRRLPNNQSDVAQLLNEAMLLMSECE